MEEKINFPNRLKYLSFALIAIGIVAVTAGFMQSSQRAWANLLLNNYFFLSIAIGASFFLAIQYITQSGWSAGFKKVPEALSAYILPAAVVMLIIVFFGAKYILPWLNPEQADFNAHELHLLHHKEPYLNNIFLIIRTIVFFSLWILFIYFLRKFSIREDEKKDITYFRKSELFSKGYIFILAFTFTYFSIDWIMTIEPIWFSTLFAVKNFVSAFYHASAIITLVLFGLHAKGYFSFFKEAHWHDLSKYLFMLSIIYGYLWYTQYMLIWYGNIPEETQYYIFRREEFSMLLFLTNIVLNFVVPFIVLLPNFWAKRKNVLASVSVILIIGHYIDLYLQIMPGTMEKPVFGFIEAGTFIGFLGLFMVSFARAISRGYLYPVNHPYLSESMKHSVVH